MRFRLSVTPRTRFQAARSRALHRAGVGLKIPFENNEIQRLVEEGRAPPIHLLRLGGQAGTGRCGNTPGGTLTGMRC